MAAPRNILLVVPVVVLVTNFDTNQISARVTGWPSLDCS